MGKTSIEWTQETWNPTRGCSRVSEGCRNCYAEQLAGRFCGKALYSTWEEGQKLEKPAGPFHLFAQRTKAGPRWTSKVELIPSMLDIPLRRKKPTTYFVNSMSDLFHEALNFEDIDQVVTTMVAADQHTYQILTKRAGRMLEYFRSGRHDGGNGPDRATYHLDGKIWLGVSVENQETADARIPLLLQTPAALRFISYEPALEAVDFTKFFSGPKRPSAQAALNTHGQTGTCSQHGSQPCDREVQPGISPQATGNATREPSEAREDIDWLICGGESGPGARPFDLAWPRSARDQCKAAGVAFFMKQFGAYPKDSDFGVARFSQKDRKGGSMDEWPLDLRVREMPVLA